MVIFCLLLPKFCKSKIAPVLLITVQLAPKILWVVIEPLLVKVAANTILYSLVSINACFLLNRVPEHSKSLLKTINLPLFANCPSIFILPTCKVALASITALYLLSIYNLFFIYTLAVILSCKFTGRSL